MLRWLRSLIAWRTVHDSGVWLYQENAVTGARRALRFSPGHQPRRDQWLAGGAWKQPLPAPPVASGRSKGQLRFVCCSSHV